MRYSWAVDGPRPKLQTALSSSVFVSAAVQFIGTAGLYGKTVDAAVRAIDATLYLNHSSSSRNGALASLPIPPTARVADIARTRCQRQ